MRELDKVMRAQAEMDKVIVGYPHIKHNSLLCLLADQHYILRGLPGTGKSLFAEVFQGIIGNSRAGRVQMTADVKPQDLSGVKVFRPGTDKFDIEEGPIVNVNYLLVDEINRAPGKTLSSLLSAMQERRVYIAGQLRKLPDPYLVIGTMNPVEQEGVYPLPEAAVDRFGMLIDVPYLSEAEEMGLLTNENLDRRDSHDAVEQVIEADYIVKLRDAIKKQIYVAPAALEYIIRLVNATRPTQKGVHHSPAWENACKKDPSIAPLIKVGAGPRAELTFRALARVQAFMSGRSYVLPDDIQFLALAVMRHRLILNDEVVMEGTTPDEVVNRVLKVVPFTDPKKNLDAYAKKA